MKGHLEPLASTQLKEVCHSPCFMTDKKEMEEEKLLDSQTPRITNFFLGVTYYHTTLHSVMPLIQARMH